MEINGRVHCFFEQSGTFKNEFKKLGIPAEDYDIQNNFGQTDNVCDLFAAIESAYDGKPSLFDGIGKDDLIMAFFPCIHFCDSKVLFYKGTHNTMANYSTDRIADCNIKYSRTRQEFFERLLQLVSVSCKNGLRLIIENPWNTSGQSYLQNNFFNPTFVDKNRALRGDYFVKPTAYWFFNCTNTHGQTYHKNTKPELVYKQNDNRQAGVCSEERSKIAPDYARNFICDFIIGKEQRGTQLEFKFE